MKDNQSLKQYIEEGLRKAVGEVIGKEVEVDLQTPTIESHGDYTSNVAMVVFGNPEFGVKDKGFKSPIELAEAIKKSFENQNVHEFKKVEVVKPGFINFWVSDEALLHNLESVTLGSSHPTTNLSGKKIMVEYAHPNTHKEMHIGHMRTLITGEAIARLLEEAGAQVFRANYQGDIGPHVAKSLYGIKKIMDEKGLSIADVEKWSNKDKAHFLGEGYALGSKAYEAEDNIDKQIKFEIDFINKTLYLLAQNNNYNENASFKERNIWNEYQRTRQWSLDYYDEFYKRFYTVFDKLFFESEVFPRGKEIVEQNIGRVFEKDQGAVVFKGEQYGLHTRVFITSVGNTTYEGKEMGNAYFEYEAFPFDLKIHVVASEQKGYFEVVFKALELLDPQKFENKQLHIPMGMVQLTDRKMSSRTGDVLTVDWLIDQVKSKVEELIAGKIDEEETLEKIAIGAVKYSVLRGATTQNVAFDIEKSVSLDGDSGPYLQYTYVRTQSIINKSKIKNEKSKTIILKLNAEELLLLRTLLHFGEVVEQAAVQYAPNLIASYLFSLAQTFNLFYQKHKIIGSAEEEFRLQLVTAVGSVIKKGLLLLGIETVEKM